MAHLERSVVSLRIIGDTLDPDEITGALGAPPSFSQSNGETLVSSTTGSKRTVKFGMWRLSPPPCEPENLDGQVEEILGKLSTDLNIWLAIGARFRVDLFCGLFMKEGNEGFSISPRTLSALGQRDIELDLDIYGSSYLKNGEE